MCDKQISTEGGTLMCDLKKGHKEAHHAAFKGGLVPFPDQRKDPSNMSPIRDDRGNTLQVHQVEAFEIEWPHEGQHSSEAVVQRRG